MKTGSWPKRKGCIHAHVNASSIGVSRVRVLVRFFGMFAIATLSSTRPGPISTVIYLVFPELSSENNVLVNMTADHSHWQMLRASVVVRWPWGFECNTLMT